MLSERKVDRRGYVKYAAAGVIVVAGAAVGAYYASRPTPTVTPKTVTKTQAPQTITRTVVPTPTGVPSEKVTKVHIVLYGYHDEGAWDPQLYESLMEAVTQSEHTYRVTMSENVKSEDAETILELAAKENDVVIASTCVYDEACRMVASRFPDVCFVLESDPIGKDPKSIVGPDQYPPNVILLGPGCLENNYVAGALAAKLVGPNAKLGFIQALDIPIGVHNGATFRLGAQSIYPDIEVLRDVMGDFVVPIKCRDSISFMAKHGAKAILIEQDDTSGILECAEQGIYAIPMYKDLTEIAPDTIICSTTWNWRPGFLDILDAVAEDRWEKIRAENWYWEMTLANGGLGLGRFGHMVTDELKSFAEELINKITSGEVAVPYIDQW